MRVSTKLDDQPPARLMRDGDFPPSRRNSHGEEVPRSGRDAKDSQKAVIHHDQLSGEIIDVVVDVHDGDGFHAGTLTRRCDHGDCGAGVPEVWVDMTRRRNLAL